MKLSKYLLEFIYKHILHTCKFLNLDYDLRLIIMNTAIELINKANPDVKPPEIVYKIHEKIREITNDPDPYKSVKEQSTIESLKLYPYLKSIMEDSENPLETAVRIAIAGNIIDFGTLTKFDISKNLKRILVQPFAIDHINEFKQRIKKSKHVLYIADNAGETVFDKVLIEILNQNVVYAVKSGPIINDATVDDAKSAGIDECAELISCGAQTPGTILRLCNKQFIQEFNNADTIIAKGQANFMMLNNTNNKIFNLLQIKNEYLAYISGLPQKSIVIKRAKIQ